MVLTATMNEPIKPINPIERPDRQPFQARSASVEAQKAIYKAIKEAGINVWDGTNRKPSYPFVKLGEELTSGSTISKDSTGRNLNLTLHIWSDFPDTAEVKSLGDFLIERLIYSPLYLENGFCVGNRSLDHVRYTEASNGMNKGSRGYLFLDFQVIDSWNPPI